MPTFDSGLMMLQYYFDFDNLVEIFFTLTLILGKDIGTEPGVRKSECPLLACYNRLKFMFWGNFWQFGKSQVR